MHSLHLRATAVAGSVLIAAGTSGALIAIPAAAAPAGTATISEIAYAGADDTDFIEIAADPGTDLSGWTVGSVTRGGDPQSDAHVVTLPAGTTAPDSGAHAVMVPITNSVKSGTAADGAYGSSAFVVDADGELQDFAQVGGTAGGRGVTAGSSDQLPEAAQGAQATPTGATAPKGQSIQKSGSSWSAGTPTPGELSGDAPNPDPTDDLTDDPTDPANLTPISEIQGTGQTSPLDGKTVSTRGVVTAAYPEGGLDGYFIQTAGSGGDAHQVPGASEGLFVYSKDTVGTVKPGVHVEVTGTVSEYYGQTQITVTGSGLTELSEPAEAPKPFTGALPDGDEARESLEGMLVHPAGPITVADTYTANRYGEVGLTNGTKPLRHHTDAHRPGTDEAKKLEAENNDRFYLLDDGATRDFTGKASDVPVPYVSLDNPVRVGAEATFTSAAVLGYGHDTWRLQPTATVTGDNEDEAAPATFANNRPAAPEAVGGQLSIASYNVLNYFPTTGDELSGCQYYTDREGNPITVRSGCAARGAANAENFERQQAKIVNGINTLDASIVALEEIEQSAAFGKDRDDALNQLVDALNAAAGSEKWAAAASPEQVPAVGEDVIRTAFIYQTAKAEPVGTPAILDNAAYKNARAPLAQAFAKPGDTEAEFVAIVNHFKSKGSGSGDGNEDSGDGQGASNADRVKQAKALVGFADEQKKATGTDKAFLLGDFNSYTFEDPMQVFYEAGYTNLGEEHTDEQTYLFGGRVGSLDHILASAELAGDVTGADVWNINSGESVGLEYSRYNNNVRNLYDDSVFRSSDHDPLIVGFNVDEDAGEEPTDDPSQDPTVDPTVDPSDDPSDDNGDDQGNNDDDQGQNDDDQGQDDGDRKGSPDSSKDPRTDRQHSADDRRLPRTGMELGSLAVAGVLVGLGAGAVALTRRRKG
ncbi:ExeM/NucH family extracellular endonuclease [Brevibacterium luteolum]|uniref:ExeM/NucH family extracellular endonuclease n=1 Tax=Brevibacterium luteolum TaxID=199591 RepID=A0A849APJ3_9MICO|nr:ExeM/NucH family extracellular endonuclease [Brevibacterium luteolum]MBM7530464.1 putative extracellular nuclease [Brevibacterium luteolum]NNG77860.1 ExeM/NucH family extracellular endonuclease [Brevibacterium luteolum]